jgi:hypothetical protein
MFLMGLITCILGAMSMGVIPTGELEELKKIPYISQLALGVLVLGIVCITIGVLGCCLAKKKNCLFATPFIILTGIIGLICLILGFVMVSKKGSISELIDGACETAVTKLSTEYSSAVDNTMCSDQCLCDPGQDMKTKEVVWSGVAGLKWADAPGSGVSNYMACYASQSTKSSDTAKFFDEGGKDILLQLEESFDCAGYCTVGKFFIGKDLSYGPPTTDCVRGTINGLAGKAGAAAYVSIVTGLVLFIAMVGAFPLCTGFEKP